MKHILELSSLFGVIFSAIIYLQLLFIIDFNIVRLNNLVSDSLTNAANAYEITILANRIESGRLSSAMTSNCPILCTIVYKSFSPVGKVFDLVL